MGDTSLAINVAPLPFVPPTRSTLISLFVILGAAVSAPCAELLAAADFAAALFIFAFR
jgi:hypothetical protein